MYSKRMRCLGSIRLVSTRCLLSFRDQDSICFLHIPRRFFTVIPSGASIVHAASSQARRTLATALSQLAPHSSSSTCRVGGNETPRVSMQQGALLRKTEVPGDDNKEIHSPSSLCSSSGSLESSSIQIGPRILFFGGDDVSLIALKEIVRRMEQQSALLNEGEKGNSCSGERWLSSSPPSPQSHKTSLLLSHLEVVCPSAPTLSLSQYHRQFPIARYCAEKGILFHTIDHPKSLIKSSFDAETQLMGLPESVDRWKVPSWEALQQRHPCLSGATCAAPPSVLTTEQLLPLWRDLFFDAGAAKDDLAKNENPPPLLPVPLANRFDVAVVVSFRYFLPSKLLRILPPVINLHPSLLPKFRGASPIFSTLLRGERRGGYSIIKIREKEAMDSGDVLLQEAWDLPLDQHIGSYFPEVTQRGAKGLTNILFGEEKSTTAQQGLPPSIRSVEPPTSSTQLQAPPPFYGCRPRLGPWWNKATTQPHKELSMKDDPFHAPLLDKQRCFIYTQSMTAADCFHTWRAFAPNPIPSIRMQATIILDKGATPVREQLLKREQSKQQVGLQGTAEERLRTTSLVVDAVHPELVPVAVLQELDALQQHPLQSQSLLAGSAYFPRSDLTLGAVRCSDGQWFVWRTLQLKNSTPQNAKKIREGLAMRTGCVYPRLFL